MLVFVQHCVKCDLDDRFDVQNCCYSLFSLLFLCVHKCAGRKHRSVSFSNLFALNVPLFVLLFLLLLRYSFYSSTVGLAVARMNIPRRNQNEWLDKRWTARHTIQNHLYDYFLGGYFYRFQWRLR